MVIVGTGGAGTPRVTVAEAGCVGSAWLVAMTLTVCPLSVAGAVYRPVAPIEPKPTGLSDHVTAVLVAFVTVAVNCWVPPVGNDATPGETVTATGGIRVIVAFTGVEFAPSVVAETVIVCCVSMVAGAV